jgi:integrase
MARKANRRQHGEGSLYQRSSDGRWVAVADLGWKNGHRDRRSFYGTTPEEAKDGRDIFLDRRRDGFTLPKGRPPTVGEWACHWLYKIIRKRVQDTTFPTYRSKTELHIIPYFSRTPLANHEGGINEEVIEEWHDHLKRLGLSPATITHTHRLLSQILKTAVIRGRLMRNPASNVHPPQATRAEPMPPEEDEVHAILLACEDRRTGPRWVTGLETGARQGEALGLLWPLTDLDDVDNAHLSIEWELVRLPWQHGCQDPHACGAKLHRYPCPQPCPKAARTSGRPHTACITARDKRLCPPDCTAHARSCPQRHGGGLILKRPKSEKSIRTIPISRFTALALRSQKQMQREERLALGPEWTGWAHHCDRKPRRRETVCPDCRMPYRPDTLAFTQPNGRPVDPRADWGDWCDLLDACGLDHYRIHDGRHGAATSLLEEGVDIRVVQEIMGHSTPDFTRRSYQHVRAKLKRDASDALTRRMWRHKQ